MEGHRPRVILNIGTRLFRDALARALAPYVDVVVAPESDVDLATWAVAHAPFDAAIVSAGRRLIDVDVDLVVELPPADGQASLGHVVGVDRAPVRSLADLLALLEVDPA